MPSSVKGLSDLLLMASSTSFHRSSRLAMKFFRSISQVPHFSPENFGGFSTSLGFMYGVPSLSSVFLSQICCCRALICWDMSWIRSSSLFTKSCVTSGPVAD